jgi:uncharacterized protein (DUF362 family)
LTPRVSRREFLRTGIQTAALLGLAGGVSSVVRPLLAAEPQSGSRGLVDLAVVRGTPEVAVRRAIDLLGGIGKFVKRGDFVLLKPNMSFGTPPEVGATTSPEVVAGMAALCLEAGAGQVLVADHTIRSGKVSLEYTGIQAACAGMDRVTVASLNDETRYREIPIPGGKVLKKTAVANDAFRADVRINLPVAKSHSATGVSLALKNLMGLVWDRQVFHTGDLSQSVADLATVLRCELTVMDAMRAMVQGGPSGPGRTEPLDRIIAGVDPVAVDSYTVSMTKWYNRRFTGRMVKHILAASELGVGEIDVERLNVVVEGGDSGRDEGQTNH